MTIMRQWTCIPVAIGVLLCSIYCSAVEPEPEPTDVPQDEGFNVIQSFTLSNILLIIFGLRLMICFLITFVDTQTGLEYDEDHTWAVFQAFFFSFVWNLLQGFDVGLWHLIHSMILLLSISLCSWGAMRIRQVRFVMFPFGRAMVKRERVKQEEILVVCHEKDPLDYCWLDTSSFCAYSIGNCALLDEFSTAFGMEHFSMAQFLLSSFRYKAMREGDVRLPSISDHAERASKQKEVKKDPERQEDDSIMWQYRYTEIGTLRDPIPYRNRHLTIL